MTAGNQVFFTKNKKKCCLSMLVYFDHYGLKIDDERNNFKLNLNKLSNTKQNVF